MIIKMYISKIILIISKIITDKYGEDKTGLGRL